MHRRPVSSDDVLGSLMAGVLVITGEERIQYANPAAARILRRPTEQLLGHRLEDVLVPLAELGVADIPETRHELSIVLGETEIVLGYTLSPPNASGTRSLLFQELGGVLQLRRERDRLLQMAALGDALPSILHELRNPLAAVTGSLEVLLEESHAEGPLRDDLHAILWEVRRMNLTLQGVGGLVRSVHTKHHVSVDLAVGEACRILEPTAARRGIQLTSEIPSLPLLPLDWGVVSGVVFNLVKNSIDACGHDDSIVVRANLTGDRFVLSVSDSGEGMAPEILNRCRELFYTSKEKGSGIGLALCQQIAESSGGELEIESSLGEGTVVTLAIPLHPERASSGQHPLGLAPRGNDETVKVGAR